VAVAAAARILAVLGALASVVIDPFLVELDLALSEPSVDGLAVDLRGTVSYWTSSLG
jgi:hypothetical protein